MENSSIGAVPSQDAEKCLAAGEVYMGGELSHA